MLNINHLPFMRDGCLIFSFGEKRLRLFLISLDEDGLTAFFLSKTKRKFIKIISGAKSIMVIQYYDL